MVVFLWGPRRGCHRLFSGVWSSQSFKGRIQTEACVIPSYHGMLMCIRQESKRNDDSVSVEELDWYAESQVLIPAEHLWCDFKCKPWATNSSPNTNDLYIHYMDTPFFRRKKQRCSAGIRTWLSADQSSSSTLTQSSFLFDPCLIHRDTVMLE